MVTTCMVSQTLPRSKRQLDTSHQLDQTRSVDSDDQLVSSGQGQVNLVGRTNVDLVCVRGLLLCELTGDATLASDIPILTYKARQCAAGDQKQVRLLGGWLNFRLLFDLCASDKLSDIPN